MASKTTNRQRNLKAVSVTPAEPSNDLTNDLSLADLEQASEELVPVRIPSIKKNGKPGVLYLRRVSTDFIMKRSEAQTGEIQEKDRSSWIVDTVVACTVNRSGQRIFNSPEQLNKVPADVFAALASKVSELTSLASTEAEGEG